MGFVRLFNLGTAEDENMDSNGSWFTRLDKRLVKGRVLVTIRALNEFDPRAQGAGRSKLDSQRDAVVSGQISVFVTPLIFFFTLPMPGVQEFSCFDLRPRLEF